MNQSLKILNSNNKRRDFYENKTIHKMNSVGRQDIFLSIAYEDWEALAKNRAT